MKNNSALARLKERERIRKICVAFDDLKTVLHLGPKVSQKMTLVYASMRIQELTLQLNNNGKVCDMFYFSFHFFPLVP